MILTYIINVYSMRPQENFTGHKKLSIMNANRCVNSNHRIPHCKYYK